MTTAEESTTYTGAEVVLRTAVAAGIDICFANPGTTELSLVHALDRCPQLRAVLAVFEGVCTGAADGYTRISGRPALALLHLGPGLANGLANLHNARKAGSPVISIVGEHATWHIAANAPLTSDIATLAQPMSCFVRTAARPESVAADMAEVIARAAALPSGPATLILPADVQWARVTTAPLTPQIPPPTPPDPATIERAARALRAGAAALVLGGRALRTPGLQAAERIARATACRVLAPTFPAVMDRGAGLLSPDKIPYPPEPARQLLAPYRTVLLAGAGEPVAFFGYPNGRSGLCAEDADILPLCGATVDPVEALVALADTLGAPAPRPVPAAPRPQPPMGALTPISMCQAIAAAQPEGVIVMDEGATAGFAYYGFAAGAPPFTYMALTGGSIGQGLPCAVGAAAAAPDRRVLCLEGDGSSLYTIQALWTMARERQHVTTVICKNRAYAILRWELERAHMTPGAASLALTGLDRPDFDFVKLAQGFGVEAKAVFTAEELTDALHYSFRTPGPMLIEANLA
ncbi:MAG: acetolactate synthase large subunit [Candidatus Binatia bacterium]|nr:acetolactate synthase large subunit [Candidatus Binatia bacterium]